MYAGIWSNLVRKLLRAYAGLPRRGIGVRASSQVFHANGLEELIEGVWRGVVQQFLANCWPALRRSQPFGGINVVS
jgi:hypothetical protein